MNLVILFVLLAISLVGTYFYYKGPWD